MTSTAFALIVPDLRSILPKDTFTYSVPDIHDAATIPGARVVVPFGAREVIGYVVERTAASEVDDPRAVASVLEEPPPLLPYQVALARFVAARYCAPLGEVVKAMLPAGVRSARPGGRKRGPRTTSRAVAGRRAGSFARVSRRTLQTPGGSVPAGGEGSPSRCPTRTCRVDPANGGLPTSIS